jgi:hypothetical protein
MNENEITKVYVIMSPNGSIYLNFDGIGTCFIDKELADEALESKNKWSESKGYGVHELITLEVER